MEENTKWKENDIVSYGEPYKKGLMSREGEILLDKDSNKFTSLIPSRNNMPHLPIVATFNKDGGATKGVIVINQEGSYSEIPFDGSRYSYIDGFDGGLARVNQINNRGEKKWGIIGLSTVDNKLVVKEIVEPKYDEIWNFYDKERSHVPAILDGSRVDISLDYLRSHVDMIDGQIISAGKREIVDEYVSVTSVSMQNFKRYKEHTQIDLSSRITFVVGKNNSGKSTFLNTIELCSDNLYRLLFTDEGEPFFCFDSYKRNVDAQNELFHKYRSFNSLESEPLLLAIVSGDWKFVFQMDDSALISTITALNIVNGDKAVFSKGKTEIYYQNKYPHIYEAENMWIVKRRDGDRGFDSFFNPLTNSITNFSFKSFPIGRDAWDASKDIKRSIDKAITGCNGIERVNIFPSIGQEKYRHFQIGIGNEIYFPETKFVGDSVIHYYDLVERKDIQKRYHNFVCKWLQRMDIGVDFDIQKNNKEESYTIQIVQENGSRTDLCQMGSGSIHFIALCFHILTLLKLFTRSVEGEDKEEGSNFTPILLIEEPEQNLHPMLQSHIANFLLDISDFYAETYKEDSLGRKIGLKIIVETHSEYIIRRSQVISKRFFDRGKDTPYRVYYFPSDDKPFDMEYRKNGRFTKEFGSGFIDESSILSFQLM